MRVREFRGRGVSRRGPLALLLTLALLAVLAPARAQQSAGPLRPRRAEPQRAVTSTAATNQPKTQATPTPQPASRPASPQATPTPQPGSPRLTISPGAAPQATPTPEEGQELDPEEVVRVDTQLINLQVRVVDRNNRPINDVRKEEFRVFDNGVQQTIEFFSTEEVPITYGLVIDNSGSLRHQINQVIEAGKTIINSNRPGDETFVVRFVDSEKIEIKQDFTADQTSLFDALEDMYIEGGQTAVIDAVYLSAEHAASHKKGNDLDDRRRRALVLVTDGEDRNSFYNEKSLFEALREQDVQIFIIGFVNELEKEGGFIRKSKREKATDLLNRLAKETGGRAFYPNSLSELPQIAKEITKDLRTQYVIGYNPTNKARPGEFHPVRVSVEDKAGRDRRIAITRPGYTARADGGVTAAPVQRPGQPNPARRP